MSELDANCGLCDSTAELRESHLLPAAAFRLARETNAKNPNPIVVTPRGIAATSRQVSTKFLCSDCEDRFSRLGERHVFSQCLRGTTTFALRTKLLELPSIILDERVAAYDVTDCAIRPEPYLYFAASVFWRASARKLVSRWPARRTNHAGASISGGVSTVLAGESFVPGQRSHIRSCLAEHRSWRHVRAAL